MAEGALTLNPNITELVAWEKEISGVKSRIQEVTQNIFERAND